MNTLKNNKTETIEVCKSNTLCAYMFANPELKLNICTRPKGKGANLLFAGCSFLKTTTILNRTIETIHVIIHGGKIWTNLFFPCEKSARNYIKFRVPTSYLLIEKEHNVFISKRYQSKYTIIELKNYMEEVKKIKNELSSFKKIKTKHHLFKK